MEKFLKLAQLLNSKLCHDLAGLIGAVNNCVELIESTNKAAQETAKKLLDTNSKKLVSVLRFYRILYGFADSEDEMSLDDLKILINETVKDEKLPIFDNQIKENIPLSIAKIIMGIYICARNNITREGKITVNISIIKNNFVIKIKASGTGLKVKENKTYFLTQQASLEEINVQNAHEFYIFHLCSQENLAIKIVHLTNSIEYVIKKI